jgi:hypothetical protein
MGHCIRQFKVVAYLHTGLFVLLKSSNQLLATKITLENIAQYKLVLFLLFLRKVSLYERLYCEQTFRENVVNICICHILASIMVQFLEKNKIICDKFFLKKGDLI